MFILSVGCKRESKPSRISVVYFKYKIIPTAPTASIFIILKCLLTHLQSDALRSCGQSHPALTHCMMKESEIISAASIHSGHLILTFHFTKGDTEDLKGHASSLTNPQWKSSSVAKSSYKKLPSTSALSHLPRVWPLQFPLGVRHMIWLFLPDTPCDESLVLSIFPAGGQ